MRCCALPARMLRTPSAPPALPPHPPNTRFLPYPLPPPALQGQEGEHVLQYWPFEESMRAPLAGAVTKRTHPMYLTLRGEGAQPRPPMPTPAVCHFRLLLRSLPALLCPAALAAALFSPSASPPPPRSKG